MGRINVLDKLTAEKIAAGEVVERPGSVIKELVENAIDAGATSIVVEIKRGGTSYMRVTDNGCGMDKDDARTAFLRHATSKIQTDKDLEHITTLGFRGEALCSVAAVSRTELFTKRRTEDEGTHVIVEGGDEILFESAGCPDGTTIVVKNLFFNTPARMKFMKKDSVEASFITDICNKQALSHPDISLRLIRDGKEVLFTPGDNILKNAVHSVLGKDIASSTLSVSYTKDSVKVEGLTGKGNLSRPNRLMQIFFVNGRYVINKTLSLAISEAYKNELMIGRFPVCVLNINLDASLVDVNVHPGKTEIKFASDQSVYEAVYWAVKNTLSDSSSPREAILPENKNAFKMPLEKSAPVQISFSSQKENKLRFEKLTPKKEEAPAFKMPPSLSQIKEEVSSYEGKLPVKEIERLSDKKENIFIKEEKPSFSPPIKEEKKEAPIISEIKEEKPILPEVRIIGQLFSTYILAEGDGEFFLMDQHAAHERIRFEEIKQSGYKTDSQLLLMPLSVNLTPTEKDLAEKKRDFLLSLGFEFEDFGKNTVLLRSLPSDSLYEDGEDLFIELLGVLSGDEGGNVLAMRDKAVYTVACRSAIKANQSLTLSELEKLFCDAMALEGISTCPHGRPICVKLTKYQIEKMFGRIV